MKSLDTQVNKPTNQNTLKVPKVVEPTNKKLYYKTLGTSVVNSPIPLSPIFLRKTGLLNWKISWKCLSLSRLIVDSVLATIEAFFFLAGGSPVASVKRRSFFRVFSLKLGVSL